MQILELIAGGSEPLKAAFAVQRSFLEKKATVMSVDISRMNQQEKTEFFAVVHNLLTKPDIILLRGIEALSLVSKAVYKVPIFIDHCTPFELGRTSPLRSYFDKQVFRVYCYSQKSESELRQAGIGRIRVVAGPAIPTEVLSSSSNGVPRVAFLSLCSQAQSVLTHTLKIRDAQRWSFEAVSPLKNQHVLQVADNFEAAEAADFIVAPYEDKDFGQPHDGAILALAVGKPMTTIRTYAFSIMGFPAKHLIPAEKHLIGTYAAAVGMYLRARDKYDGWTVGVGPDPYELPRDLLTRVT